MQKLYAPYVLNNDLNVNVAFAPAIDTVISSCAVFPETFFEHDNAPELLLHDTEALILSDPGFPAAQLNSPQ